MPNVLYLQGITPDNIRCHDMPVMRCLSLILRVLPPLISSHLPTSQLLPASLYRMELFSKPMVGNCAANSSTSFLRSTSSWGMFSSTKALKSLILGPQLGSAFSFLVRSTALHAQGVHRAWHQNNVACNTQLECEADGLEGMKNENWIIPGSQVGCMHGLSVVSFTTCSQAMLCHSPASP